MFKKIMILTLVAMVITLASPLAVLANGNTFHNPNVNTFHTPNGRTGPLTANDYHTAAWQRFNFNYQFSSGVDFRYVLGSPTQVSTFRHDAASLNVRRDRHVSHHPPAYGVFSVIMDTNHLNPTFATWTNWQDGMPFVFDDPNSLSIFDTLQQGVNNRYWQHSQQAHTSTMPAAVIGGGAGYNKSMVNHEFLPPTSVMP